MTSDSHHQPLLREFLRTRQVHASVVDIDHYRIRGGMAVETDYILELSPAVSVSHPTGEGGDTISVVSAPNAALFTPFRLAKTFTAFRTLAQQLKAASDRYTSKSTTAASLPHEAVEVANFCELVFHLVQSQKLGYVGQVNFRYIQVVALQRRQLIDRVLDASTARFPPMKHLNQAHPLVETVAHLIESFFLTDHCNMPSLTTSSQQHDKRGSSGTTVPIVNSNKMELHKNLNPLEWLPFLDLGSNKMELSAAAAPAIVPLTRRDRRSALTRALDEKDLLTVGDKAKLLMDDDRSSVELVPSYSRPVPVVRSGATKIGTLIDNNPFFFALIFVVAVYILKQAAATQLRLDGDLALLVIFAAFCLGLHTPRPLVGGFDRPPTMKGTVREVDTSGRRLLQRSMNISPRKRSVVVGRRDATATAAASSSEDLDTLSKEEGLLSADVVVSPMTEFPHGAPLGSVTNCWGESDPADFRVRGPYYFRDRKKVPSQDFLFHIRGAELFLTDTCPQNVGSYESMLHGDLRKKPTFIVNFRLPWGVMILYFEIPDMYVPFIRAGHEDTYDVAALPSTDQMTPGQRATCRFLQSDVATKNKTLKIVPVVVKGPWVVRQVVGGKPAIIGNKLPIHYVYDPGNDKDAMYLEADLDIAASSAARGILSVARTYTNVLTLDLGFVVQSNEQDELPECMLVGSRLHGVDPLTAPQFPTSDEVFVDNGPSSDEGSVTPHPLSSLAYDDSLAVNVVGQKILSLQSHVVSGYVGNKAAVFPLQLLGFDVDFVNSVHFSNHTGYPKGWEGDVLKGEQLDKILAGLERNGLLSDIQHILTGYIGSETFLESILKVVKSVRKYGKVRYVCDPVLGDRASVDSTDSGKFYVPENLVEVYKKKVLPIADVLTPNQFEVEQLTGIKVTSLQSVKQACAALHDMGPGLVFVTSCVFASNTRNISIVASQRQENGHMDQWILEVPIVTGTYTGTGDLCSALLLAHTARFPDNLPKAMELVSNTMQAVVERTHEASSTSVKSCELRLIQSQSDIENPTIRYKCRKLSS